MAMILSYLTKRFTSKAFNDRNYIEYGVLFKLYKEQPGKSRATIKDMINDLNVPYVILYNNGNLTKDLTIDSFRHRSHKLLLDMQTLVNNEQIMLIITKNYQKDYESSLDESISDDTPDIQPVVAPAPTTDPMPAESNQYQLIELKDHEKFRDSEGNVFEIEVRGVRTEDGLLFWVKQIGQYLGMDSLKRVLQNVNNTYQKDIHWVKLYKYSSGIYNSMLSDNLSSANQNTIIWKRYYLNWTGLLKVIFSSRSANENITKLRKWVIRLVYTHQMGSDVERMDLIETLKPFQMCLNKLSGIYLIRIGKVKDLRENMQISSEKYPFNEFDKANVFKFGRSDDVMKRFQEHRSRIGYGKYASNIDMEWFVLIPQKLLASAECELNKFFESNLFKFEFNDGYKDHTELVIAKTGIERAEIKKKYFDLVQRFPSDSNVLIEQMIQMKTNDDNQIALFRSESENTIQRIENEKKIMSIQFEKDLAECKSATELAKSQSATELVKSATELLSANHKIEILQMQLKMAEMMAQK